MRYISMKFHENILNGFELESWHKTERVTVLVLCTLSENALYFYEIAWKYLEKFSSYRADTKQPLSNFKGDFID